MVLQREESTGGDKLLGAGLRYGSQEGLSEEVAFAQRPEDKEVAMGLFGVRTLQAGRMAKAKSLWQTGLWGV